MKNFIIFVLSFLTVNYSWSQSLSQEDQESVRKFISYIKNNRSDLIASEMTFPFRRKYPIPDVKDSADFVLRFTQIFDKEIIKTIKRSNVTKDWSHVGWRGIMFIDGVLWLDEDGRLRAVNHQTKYEVDLRQQLINTEKSTLHSTIQNYYEPICILETEKYRVRIDRFQDQSYRYTSWNKGSKIDSNPDLLLTNGKINFDGSSRNHQYTFTSGEYKYEVSVIVMGEPDAPDAILTIFKNDKEIIMQPGTLKVD